MKEQSVAIYSEKLKETEKQLTNIFNEVMDNKISLKRKIELRKESLRISIELFKTIKECIILGKKELKNIKISNGIEVTFIILLTFAAIISLFFNPFISLGLLSFAMIKSLSKIKSLRTEMDESKKMVDDVLCKIKQISILMDNIDRRLNLDITVNVNNNIECEMDKIDLANNVIIEYLETGIINEVDEDIKLYIIKLLQSDLKNEEYNKEECNMESLLKLAKEKIVKESKEQGIKLIKGE